MRKRKNLIPTLLLAILFWGGLGCLVYKVSPHTPLPLGLPIPIPSLPLFFLLLFLAFFLSFALLFNNTRRGFLLATGLTALVLLRFFNLLHPLYIVLVIALLVTLELYFLKK